MLFIICIAIAWPLAAIILNEAKIMYIHDQNIVMYSKIFVCISSHQHNFDVISQGFRIYCHNSSPADIAHVPRLY
jgi:hypothetical protein